MRPISNVMESLSELFYVLEAWDQFRQTDWMKMTPMEQLDRCNERRGWVGDPLPLPFNLEHAKKPPILATFNAVRDTPVTVLLTPRHPYVIHTTQLRELCDLKLDLQSDGMLKSVKLGSKPGIT